MWVPRDELSSGTADQRDGGDIHNSSRKRSLGAQKVSMWMASPPALRAEADLSIPTENVQRWKHNPFCESKQPFSTGGPNRVQLGPVPSYTAVQMMLRRADGCLSTTRPPVCL